MKILRDDLSPHEVTSIKVASPAKVPVQLAPDASNIEMRSCRPTSVTAESPRSTARISRTAAVEYGHAARDSPVAFTVLAVEEAGDPEMLSSCSPKPLCHLLRHHAHDDDGHRAFAEGMTEFVGLSYRYGKLARSWESA
jgi:hypothetical protein